MIIKAIKPMFTAVVTTMDKYTADDFKGKLITNLNEVNGAVKEYQTVVAVGTQVRDIAVGDIVKINPMRYAVRKYAEDSVKKDLLGQKIEGFNFPEVELNGIPHLYLQQNDIEYVVTEWEDEKPESSIIHPDKSIIIP